jgi:putative tryptophan/tyrosine transport system substrate-binding protein
VQRLALDFGRPAWPLAARAQQPGERTRRISVLHTPAADDPDGQARNAAFLQGLQQFGWTDGRNVRIDTRWSAGDFAEIKVRSLLILSFCCYFQLSLD